MTTYYCGLDLGQVRDYSALAVVSYSKEYREARRKRDDIERYYERRASERGLESVSQLSSRLAGERERALAAHPLPEPAYVVRHLQRFPLRSRYQEVVEGVRSVLSTPPLEGDHALAVDATGVGAAVTDMLRATGLGFRSVTITGGEKQSREGNSYRVPKRDLVARAQILLQNRRLKVVPTLKEAGTLTEELNNFRYKISPAGRDSYEAWREGDHDDLVLAVALACWLIPEGGEVRLGPALAVAASEFDADFTNPWGSEPDGRAGLGEW